MKISITRFLEHSLSRFTAVVVLGAGLMLTGCGETEEASTGGEGMAGVGASAERAAGLPEGLRDDVPVFPGMNITEVTQVGDGFELSGFASASVETIGAYYDEAIGEYGWMLDQSLSDIGSASARAYELRKDERAVTVLMADSGDGTQLEIATRNSPMY